MWAHTGIAHDLIVALFATAAGFTASGIMANLYKLVANKPETLSGRIGYVAVMVLAGPNVLFGNATTSFRKKSCSTLAYWIAAAITAYWSFVIGLFLLDLSLAF
jgi:hypothetical protein